jgi:trigger factor
VNIQIQDDSPTRKTLTVTFTAAEIDAEHGAVVNEFSRAARLPGFRPGKAPAALVQKRYAKEIADEFRQKTVTKAYRQGLEESKLEVITVINVEEGTLTPGQDAAIKITLDVRPQFELPAYGELPTTVAPTTVGEAEIDAVIERMRSERADFSVAERAAAKGDYVKLAYEGSVDGQAITDLVPDKAIYGKVPQTWEEVEGEQEGLIPGLGKQLAGLKAGDKKDLTVTFPVEFTAAPALAGKSAVYAVEIQEVRERVLPPLDEAFCQAHRADDLAGLRTNVSNQLKAQKEHANRAEQRRQVTEALLAAVEIPVPESMVEGETQSVLRRFIEENMRRGVPAEQFEKDKEQLYASAREAATGRVKSELILAKIAEKEQIKVVEQDLNGFIYQEAMRTRQAPDKLAKDLGKDRERLRAVQQSIILDKALDLVVSKATVTESAPAA